MINNVFLRLGIHRNFPWLLPYANTFRMNPSFFLIGFQKCGTTTIYHQIMKVKGMVPGLVKENDNLSRKKADPELFRLFFPYKWTGKWTGDASHLHTFAPSGIDNIQRYFPDAKLIVVMRNPVDRAFSHFNMDQRNGYFPAHWSFMDYVDVELKVLEKIRNIDDMESIYWDTKIFQSKYGWALTRSLYYPYVKKAIESSMPLHIMFLEDYERSYNSEMQKLLQFLALPEDVPNIEKKNIGVYPKTLNEEVHSELMKFFEPHDLKLRQLIGRDLPWRQ